LGRATRKTETLAHGVNRPRRRAAGELNQERRCISEKNASREQKTEKWRRTIREEDTQRDRRRAIGNPSACFVEGEYGPGRTDGRRQKQNAWMDPSAQRGKDPARAGINTKNHTENEDFRSKTRTPRTPQTHIFSMEIQHGSYTAEVTALPPSF
jgi:hypothetical protein